MNKNFLACISLIILLLNNGCKKEDLANNNQTSIPRTGLELLASPDAETYMVVASPTDTFIMQNTNGQQNSLAKDQYVKSIYAVSDLITGFSVPSHYFLLHFYKREPKSSSGTGIPAFTCNLANDILSKDTFIVGAVLENEYGVALQFNYGGVNYDSDTYYRSGHSAESVTLVLKEKKITTDNNGCKTARVRGTMTCKARGLCPGNPVVIYSIAFCCNVALV